MGYTVRRKILNLAFEDPEFEGLEVRAHAVSMGKILDVADQAEAMRGGAGLKDVRGLLTMFADNLLTWNAEDEDGMPIPVTGEGLLSQDPDWVIAVVLAWFDAMVSVPGPLDRRSTSGKPFPVASIPMETPSLSPESLQKLAS